MSSCCWRDIWRARVGQGTVVGRYLPATLVHEQTDRTPSSRTDARKTSTIHLASRVGLLKEIPYPERREGRTGGTFFSGAPAPGLFSYPGRGRLIPTCAPARPRLVARPPPPPLPYPLPQPTSP